eukprot:28634_1
MPHVHNAAKQPSKLYNNKITIPITAHCITDSKYSAQYSIKAFYDENYSVKMLIDEAVKKFAHEKYKPVCFEFDHIEASSFTDFIDHKSTDTSQSLTKYDKYDIITKGLKIHFKIMYHHQFTEMKINCQHMKNANSKDPLKCPIYFAMKQKYRYTKNNLTHLLNYEHFDNPIKQKPQCKYLDECKAYIRLENGGDRFDDRCHTALYRHPPRNRNIGLSANINALVVHKKFSQNHATYVPTNEDQKQYNYTDKNGYLEALIAEVVDNGYKRDLCLSDEDFQNDKYSLLDIVDSKMKARRHLLMGSPLNRAEMLSLILYTGADCNYDLCKSQRNGDYKKWKWFDSILYNAIKALSERERGEFSVYSGLADTKSDMQFIEQAWFPTFTSSSMSRDIALTFIGGNGIELQIEPSFKENAICCDVSWISKFTVEREILFARSVSKHYSSYQLKVEEDNNGVQTAIIQESSKEIMKKRSIRKHDMMNAFRDLKVNMDPMEAKIGAEPVVNKMKVEEVTLMNKNAVSVKCHVKCSTNTNKQYDGPIMVSISYVKKITIQHLIDKILQSLHNKYTPTKFAFSYIDDESFTNKIIQKTDDLSLNKPITNYLKDVIEKKGVYITVMVPLYEHKALTEIDCPQMLNTNSINMNQCSFYRKWKRDKVKTEAIMNHFRNYCHQKIEATIDCPQMKGKDYKPLQCKHWREMKENRQYTEQNLDHMDKYTHFKNELEEKPQCGSGEMCATFQRVVNGGHDVKDICHMRVYLHPPRRRVIDLKGKNEYGAFKINDGSCENVPLQVSKADGDCMYLLIKEVIKNGYKYDLCLVCSNKQKKCKHDPGRIMKSGHLNILEIVEKKLACNRHRQMGSPLNRGEMLSILLYTGGESNWDLCKTQREGCYDKWVWFDYCLYNAIKKLGLREWGSYTLWSGVGKTR